MKNYEVLFIIPDSVKEDSIEGVITSLKRELEAGGALVSRVNRMGRKSFAHEMKRQKGGYYVTMDASLDPQKAHILSARFKLNEDVLRVQVVHKVECETAEA